MGLAEFRNWSQLEWSRKRSPHTWLFLSLGLSVSLVVSDPVSVASLSLPLALVASQPVSMRAPCKCQPTRAVSVCLVPSGVPTLPTAPGRQEALNKYFLNE